MTHIAPSDDLLWLIDRLADGAWHSGEALAAEAGISRAALSKRVALLSRFGLQVGARSGLGYQLQTPLEPLALDDLTLPPACRAASSASPNPPMPTCWPPTLRRTRKPVLPSFRWPGGAAAAGSGRRLTDNN